MDRQVPHLQTMTLLLPLCVLIMPWLVPYAAKHSGSVSAEHGIGISKVEYLPYSKSKPMLDLMQRLKAQIDPNNIMNPYKIFGIPATTK